MKRPSLSHESTMKRRRTLMGAAALACGLLSTVAAADFSPRLVAYPKDSQDVSGRTATAASRGESPDCAGAVSLAVSASLDTVLSGDTTGGTSQVGAYACPHWDESGPYAVLALQVEQDVLLSAAIAGPGGDDLDLFLLSDCDSDSCVAAHSAAFTVELNARAEPWFLVVDGYDGAEGPFELALSAAPALLSQDACDGALDVACDTTSFQGTVFDAPNLVTLADCGSYSAFGGEDWFALTLPDSAEVSVTAGNCTFDVAVWVFEGCGPDPVCIGYADSGLSGISELWEWVNDTGGETTVYLGVDSISPIGTDTGDDPLEGLFDLEVSCTVPVAAERVSAGGLKSLFR